MVQTTTEILMPDAAGTERVAQIWRAGGLVAFATETVYGLGADASDGAAVARIFEVKGRPAFNPLIVHVADFEAADRLGHFGPEARRLADAFWPGPLSLVVPLRPGHGLSPLVSAGLDTVAIRVPEAPVARALLRAHGGTIAAPSANPSGRISPTTARHVLEGLGGRIEAVVDGGPCAVGLESTIVAPGGDAPVLLRPGGLPAEIIEEALGRALLRPGDPTRPHSPGQMASHYAPAARLRMNVGAPRPGALWLGFGPGCAGAARNLSPAGDLREAAAELFGALHALDAEAAEKGIMGIDVAPIPETGLGLAINDRLRRASARER